MKCIDNSPIPYDVAYAAHLPVLGPIGQERLRQARVHVVGAGRVGSALTQYLASAGVGALSSNDHQVVEPDNLNSLAFSCADIGTKKVKVVSRRLALREHSRFRWIALPIEADEVDPYIEASDLVICCANTVTGRVGAEQKAVRYGKPTMQVGVFDGRDCLGGTRLVAQCSDRSLAAYFTRQFPQVPKSTLAALLRRIDALFIADGVRLALGGVSAPNFRQLQDEGKIVVVTSFGKSIARGVRRVLQKLVFSDITQSVFSRQKPESPFLWLCDEAQHFFHTESLRDNAIDLLTTSRSFSTHFLFLTQDLQTAVHDSRTLRVLNTNTRWCMAMRGDPADCTFLKPALPITGRRPKPRPHPFAEQSLYSPAEERALVHEDIASLPDREGYLWLKNRSAEAIRVTVADVPMPDGNALMQATSAIRQDATIGGRMSRKQYDQAVAARDQERSDEAPDLATALTRKYQSTRERGP